MRLAELNERSGAAMVRVNPTDGVGSKKAFLGVALGLGLLSAIALHMLSGSSRGGAYAASLADYREKNVSIQFAKERDLTRLPDKSPISPTRSLPPMTFNRMW